MNLKVDYMNQNSDDQIPEQDLHIPSPNPIDSNNPCSDSPTNNDYIEDPTSSLDSTFTTQISERGGLSQEAKPILPQAKKTPTGEIDLIEQGQLKNFQKDNTIALITINILSTDFKFKYNKDGESRLAILCLQVILLMIIFLYKFVLINNDFIQRMIRLARYIWTFIFFLCAYISFVDPGYICRNIHKSEIGVAGKEINCNSCNTWKSENSTHCQSCQRCVVEFDQHCRFFGNCIGKNNKGCYKLFRKFVVLGFGAIGFNFILSLVMVLFDY